MQEVTIIHDKVDHSNNIVAVEKVPEPQVSEEKPNTEFPAPETPAPVPEEKFVVLTPVETPQPIQ